MSVKITRRDALKLSGAAASGLALGGTASAWDEMAPPPGLTQQNSYFQSLKPMRRDEPLGAHEMRITFMGTSVIERRAQQRSSLFVELGNGECFVFDCGSGAVSNYVAMGVPWSRMSRIFLTHLHGDHTSDLTHIYCFGPQGDRKFPLYIWGPSKSGVPNPAYVPGDPGNPQFFEDGTIEFCKHFREMNRWHTESQSFVPTRFLSAEGDGYDIFTTELDWRHGTDVRYWATNNEIPNPSDATGDAWTAYSRNGVRVSYFPVIHDRNGSIGYRLDWLTEGLSMIFTGDTKPSWRLVHEAAAGERPVDVLVSEVVVDPEVWIERPSGLTEGDDRYAQGLLNAQAVQENSHTPQKALGYILRQLADGHKAPRLAVATHFQATDDTISLALKDIRSWYAGPVTFAMDLMVVRVTQASVVPYRAVVSDYSWSAPQARGGQTCDPKYADTRDCNYYAPMAPLAQFDDQLLDDVIAPEAYDPGGWQDLNNNGPCQDRGSSRPAGRPPRPAAPSPQA